MMYRLGIDIGTTFTAAAVAQDDVVSMLGLGNRSMQIPSVLFRLEDGEFLVGEAAERRAVSEPGRVAREFKRRIGDHVPVLVAGAPFSPESLTATLLRWVARTAADRMAGPPADIVVTHPANWGPYKLELFDQVASLAGLGPIHSCSEPVAAAAQYAARARVEVGDLLGVYDLGGGTFDVCVLEQTPDGFRLLGTPEGIEHLGGVDFDEALFDHVMGELGGRASGFDPDDPATTVGLARLRRDVVEAKEALSIDVATMVPVILPSLNTTVRITRAELEAMIRPAVLTTVEAFAQSVRSAGLTADQLDAIVLVGGSSRIPLVGELLQQEFAVPIAIDAHPKHDVASGALLVDVEPRDAGQPRMSTSSDVQSPPLPVSPFAVSGPNRPTSEVEPRIALESSAAGPPFADIAKPLTPNINRPAHGRRMMLTGLTGAVAAGVITGVLLANRPPGGGPAGTQISTQTAAATATDPPTSTGTGSPTSAASSSPPSPAASVKADPTLPRSAVLAPDRLVVPMSFDGGDHFHLFHGDAANSTVGEQITRGASSDFAAVIAPDRRSIIFTRGAKPSGSAQKLESKVGSADGKRIRNLFRRIPPECSRITDRLAWNPVDQTLLAVPCASAEGVVTLALIRTTGELVRTVDIGNPRGVRWKVGDPTFSPNGRRLVFWAGASNAGGALFITDLETDERPQPLTSPNVSGRDADPTWHPDGKSITFRRRVADGTPSGNLDIYQIKADGSEKAEPLIEGPGDDQAPTWSPDGHHLAYETDAAAPALGGSAVLRVWIADPDGANPRVLWTAGRTGQQGAPAWATR